MGARESAACCKTVERRHWGHEASWLTVEKGVVDVAALRCCWCRRFAHQNPRTLRTETHASSATGSRHRPPRLSDRKLRTQCPVHRLRGKCSRCPCGLNRRHDHRVIKAGKAVWIRRGYPKNLCYGTQSSKAWGAQL